MLAGSLVGMYSRLRESGLFRLNKVFSICYGCVTRGIFGADEPEHKTLKGVENMNLSLLSMIFNFIEAANKIAPEALALAPQIAASVSKVTDPSATVADKVNAVQEDMKLAHGALAAAGVDVGAFDVVYAPVDAIVTSLVGLYHDLTAPAT